MSATIIICPVLVLKHCTLFFEKVVVGVPFIVTVAELVQPVLLVNVITLVPGATPVTNPVFDIVATLVVADTQGFEAAGASGEVSCVVVPIQTLNVPFIVGGVHACCATLTIPVVVLPKNVAFLCVAAEAVPPHKPLV